MNAVFGSIKENLQAIEIVEAPTESVFGKDRLPTGDAREITVKQFLESYMPQDYIVKKGAIFSQDGTSQNIDCVVLAPNHPRLITPKREVIIAEGVFAAVEVKPDISVLTDGSELMRGLKQIKSVKNLNRDVKVLTQLEPLKPKYFHKIPAVIFSFKSADIEKTIKFISQKVTAGFLNKEEIPDIIVTLDRGVILYYPYLSLSPFKETAKHYYPQEKFGDAGFVYMNIEKKEDTLSFFLLSFIMLPKPQLEIEGFILKPYLLKASVDGDRLVKIYPLHNPEGIDAYMKA